MGRAKGGRSSRVKQLWEGGAILGGGGCWGVGLGDDSVGKEKVGTGESEVSSPAPTKSSWAQQLLSRHH